MLHGITTVWEFNSFFMFSVEMYRSYLRLYLTARRETYMQVL